MMKISIDEGFVAFAVMKIATGQSELSIVLYPSDLEKIVADGQALLEDLERQKEEANNE